MEKKKTVNLAVPEPLAAEFNEVCAQYGHGKQKGLVLGAAILMFLRANPEEQGRFIEELFRRDVAKGVARMRLLADARSGRLRLDAASPAPTKRAAKRSGKPRRGINRLPEIEDHG